MAPSVIMPPAPRPQKARAAMKLPMLWARAHQAVAAVKSAMEPTYRPLRPSESDRRPTRGWKAVAVSRKAVLSHEALLLAPKCDVMTGCDDAMMVPSKVAIRYVSITSRKHSQKRAWLVSMRNVGFGGSSSSSSAAASPSLSSEGGDAADGPSVGDEPGVDSPDRLASVSSPGFEEAGSGPAAPPSKSSGVRSSTAACPSSASGSDWPRPLEAAILRGVGCNLVDRPMSWVRGAGSWRPCKNLYTEPVPASPVAWVQPC